MEMIKRQQNENIIVKPLHRFLSYVKIKQQFKVQRIHSIDYDQTILSSVKIVRFGLAKKMAVSLIINKIIHNKLRAQTK